MKKMLTFLVFLLILTNAFGSDFTMDGLKYSITSSNTVKFIGVESTNPIVRIPPAVTYAGVTYPVTEIGYPGFNKMERLELVMIPATVTSIDAFTFQGCTKLTSIELPSSLLTIGKYAFVDCVGLTSLNLPSSISTISESAFSGCKALKSVTLPSSLINLENSVFSTCTGLTSVTIPTSVTSIGSDAFEMCESLTSISIPSSVNFISDRAFSESGLKKVYCYATEPPSLGQYVFICFSIDESLPIFVPASAVEAYKKDVDWGVFTDIRAIPAE